MKIYVIAGSHAQFHDCLRKLQTNPAAAVEVTRPEVLRGVHLEPEQLVYFGTWADRQDIDEVLAEVSRRAAVSPRQSHLTPGPLRA